MIVRSSLQDMFFARLGSLANNEPKKIRELEEILFSFD